MKIRKKNPMPVRPDLEEEGIPGTFIPFNGIEENLAEEEEPSHEESHHLSYGEATDLVYGMGPTVSELSDE